MLQDPVMVLLSGGTDLEWVAAEADEPSCTVTNMMLVYYSKALCCITIFVHLQVTNLEFFRHRPSTQTSP